MTIRFSPDPAAVRGGTIIPGVTLPPKLEYAAPHRRAPRARFLLVLLALGPIELYSAFTGYCYVVYGHHPVYGRPQADDGYWEALVLAALVLLVASPIGGLLCGLLCKRLGSWPRRLGAGIALAVVVFAANYCLYTLDPYGVTVWLRD